MFYYIYKILNTNTGEFYIGQRKTAKNICEDDYFGSGLWIRKKAQKYSNLKNIPKNATKNHFKNSNNIIKFIMEICDNEKILNEREFHHIGLYYKKDNLCMNLAEGGGCIGRGENSFNYDKTKYEWFNIDGRKDFLTQREFINKYNISQSRVNAVIINKNKSVDGWYINLNYLNQRYKIGEKHHNYDKTIYEWKNDKGEILNLTQKDFANKFKFSQSGVNSVVVGRNCSIHGWFLNEYKYNLSITNKSKAKNINSVVYKLSHKDGRCIETTQNEFIKTFEYNKSGVSNFLKGKRKTFKGWKIIED